MARVVFSVLFLPVLSGLIWLLSAGCVGPNANGNFSPALASMFGSILDQMFSTTEVTVERVEPLSPKERLVLRGQCDLVPVPKDEAETTIYTRYFLFIKEQVNNGKRMFIAYCSNGFLRFSCPEGEASEMERLYSEGSRCRPDVRIVYPPVGAGETSFVIQAGCTMDETGGQGD